MHVKRGSNHFAPVLQGCPGRLPGWHTLQQASLPRQYISIMASALTVMVFCRKHMHRHCTLYEAVRKQLVQMLCIINMWSAYLLAKTCKMSRWGSASNMTQCSTQGLVCTASNSLIAHVLSKTCAAAELHVTMLGKAHEVKLSPGLPLVIQ